MGIKDKFRKSEKECPACEEVGIVREILAHRDKQIEGLVATIEHREQMEKRLQTDLARNQRVLEKACFLLGRINLQKETHGSFPVRRLREESLAIKNGLLAQAAAEEKDGE